VSVLDFNGSSSVTLGSWAVKLSKIRKVTKARGSFPNDEAVMKLLHLALRNIAKKWTMPGHDWYDFMHKNSPLLACASKPAARMLHSIQ